MLSTNLSIKICNKRSNKANQLNMQLYEDDDMQASANILMIAYK